MCRIDLKKSKGIDLGKISMHEMAEIFNKSSDTEDIRKRLEHPDSISALEYLKRKRCI